MSLQGRLPAENLITTVNNIIFTSKRRCDAGADPGFRGGANGLQNMILGGGYCINIFQRPLYYIFKFRKRYLSNTIFITIIQYFMSLAPLFNIVRKNIVFENILGGRAPGGPPLNPPLRRHFDVIMTLLLLWHASSGYAKTKQPLIQ